LHRRAAERTQPLKLPFLRHPFGRDVQVHGVGQQHERGNDGMRHAAGRFVQQGGDAGLVQIDAVEWQFAQTKVRG
jgi:hypothetical protein